jgi:hypothetical protein
VNKTSSLGRFAVRENSQLDIRELARQLENWLFDGEAQSCTRDTLANRQNFADRLLWFVQQRECESFGRIECRQFLAYLNTGHQTAHGRWGIRPTRSLSGLPRSRLTTSGCEPSVTSWSQRVRSTVLPWKDWPHRSRAMTRSSRFGRKMSNDYSMPHVARATPSVTRRSSSCCLTRGCGRRSCVPYAWATWISMAGALSCEKERVAKGAPSSSGHRPERRCHRGV